MTQMPTLTLPYRGYNYVDFYNGMYSQNNLGSLQQVAATGAHSIALTPDWGIDVAESSIYAGGDFNPDTGTTDTIADQQAAIQAAGQQGMNSFMRPIIDFLYNQPSANGSEFGTQYYTTPSGFVDTNNLPSGQPDAKGGTIPTTQNTNIPNGTSATAYRGALNPADINVATFFGSPGTPGSYDWMIVQEAQAAASSGATLFAVGTELDSLADNPAYEGYWAQLVEDVRTVAPSLQLTYSANWATAGQVTFWSALDYVAVDNYVPLSNTIPDAQNDDNPSLASLIQGWTQPSNVQIAYSGGTTVAEQFANEGLGNGNLSAIDAFDLLAQDAGTTTGKIIFSELGYQNDTGAANDPTGGSNQGTPDPSLQAELYQAFYYAWGGAQQAASATGMYDGLPFALDGVYYWDWTPDEEDDDWSFSANQQAIAVAQQGFGPNNYDFVGDGYGDVLVQQQGGNGQIVYAEMINGAFVNFENVGNTPGFTVVGQGPIAGNNASDIVIQSGSGEIDYANMVGGVLSGWAPVTPTPGFSVVGVGDINDDHYADIVVQSQNTGNGQIAYANMNGGVFHNWVNVGFTPGWSVVGVGDIDDDGFADIVIQSSTNGQIAYAEMNGGQFNSYVNVGITPGWKVVGVGDVNRDGFDDVVVQNPTSGQIVFANMTNGQFNGWVNIGTAPGWNVSAVEDVIGNGFADIVVQNPGNGQIAYANMTNGTFQGWVAVANTPGYTASSVPVHAGRSSAASSAAGNIAGVAGDSGSAVLTPYTLVTLPNYGTL